MRFFSRTPNVEGLEAHGDVAGLIEALSYAGETRRRPAGEPELRVEAARALGRLGAREAVEPLITILEEGHAWTIGPLGQIGDGRAVPVLARVVADPERVFSSRAPTHGVPSTGSDLERQFEQTARSVERFIRSEARREAIRALGLIGDPAACPTLRDALHAPPSPGNEEATGTDRVAAAYALASLGEEGIDALCHECLTGGPASTEALAVLEETQGGDLGPAAASAAASAVAAIHLSQAERRAAEQEAREQRRIAEEERQARLRAAAVRFAAELGLPPETVASDGSLDLGASWREVADQCRARGWPVDEDEDVIDNETSWLHVTVTFEGERLTLSSGRTFRDVLY